ncbi:hypothetical protein DMH03_05740 [Amycolatopsis sp. WAC 01376]|uniref:hypothetical protein n=1 Tax=Amycolatopsis sp. WAC 01376 TaxID=2203195 RepID=UPI000F7767CF|nr:hypothetical protein [Amycolatopsis sp. WAC 01376]RSM66604.1 hypothetical protein DMH03_05740 [Amycolatopsis sp. WAC 01376]
MRKTSDLVDPYIDKISFGIEIGILTEDFSMALSAIQEMIDTSRAVLPASTFLIQLAFSRELDRWPAADQKGRNFRSIDSLLSQRICNVFEIADAMYANLIRRGRKKGYLEGQLHDLLLETSTYFPGSKFTRHAQKIRRGSDSKFD